MRALSVRQPWAWAIIHGKKKIENRSRRIHHRGPLLIHVAKSLDEFRHGTDYSSLIPGLPPVDDLPFGVVLGMVDVVDCLPVEEVEPGPFVEGPWCWMLENPRPIELIPFKGSLSLFDIPDRLIRRLEFR